MFYFGDYIVVDRDFSSKTCSEYDFSNLKCALNKMIELRRENKELKLNKGAYVYKRGIPYTYWQCHICKKKIPSKKTERAVHVLLL